MLEPFVGDWAPESHLSSAALRSLHDLNHRFLDLAASGRIARCAFLTAQIAPLSAAHRESLAHCPYALFDLNFADDAHWQICLHAGQGWGVADDESADREIASFVHVALFYAWHVAAGASLAAQLLLGMNPQTARAFRRSTVNMLPALAASEAPALAARWGQCTAYWNALTSAALRCESAPLRRAQLSGLQLAAAARLPVHQGGSWSELPLRAGPRAV